MSADKANGLGKMNGKVHPVGDELNVLPGYVEDEIQFEGQAIPIPTFTNELQLENDIITKNTKNQISTKVKNETNEDEKKKPNARKLKSFEIVLKMKPWLFVYS